MIAIAGSLASVVSLVRDRWRPFASALLGTCTLVWVLWRVGVAPSTESDEDAHLLAGVGAVGLSFLVGAFWVRACRTTSSDARRSGAYDLRHLPEEVTDASIACAHLLSLIERHPDLSPNGRRDLSIDVDTIFKQVSGIRHASIDPSKRIVLQDLLDSIGSNSAGTLYEALLQHCLRAMLESLPGWEERDHGCDG